MMQNHFVVLFPIQCVQNFSFFVVHNAWQTKFNITTYLAAIFYSLKISYIVNISSFIVSHLLCMHIPRSIARLSSVNSLEDSIYLFCCSCLPFIDGLQAP